MSLNRHSNLPLEGLIRGEPAAAVRRLLLCVPALALLFAVTGTVLATSLAARCGAKLVRSRGSYCRTVRARRCCHCTGWFVRVEASAGTSVLPLPTL